MLGKMHLFLVLFYFFSNSLVNIESYTVPSLESLIKQDGYPVKLYTVTTEDGYILTLHRISQGVKSKTDHQNKSSILLVPDQGGSPNNFILMGNKDSPAYYFANLGFDVWIFCSRGMECGNTIKHKSLDWNVDPGYWDFSFHEIGAYDLPSSIDLILNVTGQKNIFFIGHSVAVQEFYVMMTEKPEYNDKIKLCVSYGSAAFFKDTDYPFLQFNCQLSSVLKNIYKRLGWHELAPLYISEMVYDFFRKTCYDSKWFVVCKRIIWVFGSYISRHIDDDTIRKVPMITPLPRLGIKLVTHFMDNMNTGEFRQYDYGVKENMQIYGTKLPPHYNLSAITTPQAFFYGATDTIYSKMDVYGTIEALPNAPTLLDYEVGPHFVHLDFIMGRNATSMVYKPTAKLLRDFDAGIIYPRLYRKRPVD